ncbi:MAG TPA: TetR/AcrR family transcriptional regulator [Novosphingobium sp.]|nr:TetR/AcrR family transcriptional regulator [Novosphingobium sp.]
MIAVSSQGWFDLQICSNWKIYKQNFDKFVWKDQLCISSPEICRGKRHPAACEAPGHRFTSPVAALTTGSPVHQTRKDECMEGSQMDAEPEEKKLRGTKKPVGLRRERTRSRKEQQRAIDTRERIIEAATEEFAARGFEGTSTRAVAENAGVRHTLVTYHFDGKEGLWQAVMDRTVRSFVLRQSERLEGLRGVDEIIQLRLLLEEFVRYSASDLHLHKLMTYAASEASPQLDKMVQEYLKSYFDMIAGLIRKAQAREAFVEGDALHLHYLFIGAATRIFMQSPEADLVMGQRTLDPKFIDRHVALCMKLFFTSE